MKLYKLVLTPSRREAYRKPSLNFDQRGMTESGLFVTDRLAPIAGIQLQCGQFRHEFYVCIDATSNLLLPGG